MNQKRANQMNKEPVNPTPESMIEATPKTDALCATDTRHLSYDPLVRLARELERALIESERKLEQARQDNELLKGLHELGWAKRECPVCGASCAGAALASTKGA